MKNLIMLALCLTTITALAQQPAADQTAKQEERAKMHERVESLRVAYLTRELQLTPEEAQAFWPLYNEMHRKMKEVHGDRGPRGPRGSEGTQGQKGQQGSEGPRGLQDSEGRLGSGHGSKPDFSAMTDAEIDQRLTEDLNRKQVELDLTREYREKYKQVLPARKANMVFMLDMKFRMEIMENYRSRMDRGERGPSGLDGSGDKVKGLRNPKGLR